MDTKNRLIGHESLVVKAFREVFLDRSLRAGTLQQDLDTFLQVVKENPGTQARDVKYAEQVYNEGLLRLSTQAILNNTPEFVETEGYDEIISFLDGMQGVQEALDEDVFLASSTAKLDEDIFLTPSTVEPSVEFLDSDGPFVQAIRDFVDNRQHPFVRVVTHEGEKYVLVGTFKGTLQKGPHAGKDLNVHCTVVPHRRLYDVPEVVKVDGKVLHLTDVNPETKAVSSICVLRHRPGMKIRFWANVGSGSSRFDDPAGRRFVIITEDGWKEVSRQEF